METFTQKTTRKAGKLQNTCDLDTCDICGKTYNPHDNAVHPCEDCGRNVCMFCGHQRVTVKDGRLAGLWYCEPCATSTILE